MIGCKRLRENDNKDSSIGKIHDIFGPDGIMASFYRSI